MTGTSLRRELSLGLTCGGDNDGAGAGQDDSCNRDMLLSNFLQNQNNEEDNRVTQLQNTGPGFQTESDADPEEEVSNSDILKAVVEGHLLQHQHNVAIQRILDSLDKLNLSSTSKSSGSGGAAAAASSTSTQDQDVVVTDFREIKSAGDLTKFGFTFSAENKVVLCDLCQTEFKYSGLDYDGDIQSRDFMNLKKNLKGHLQSQKHVAKEVQKKKENEKDKQLLSRNQLAAQNLGRAVYANVKMRQSLEMFEDQVMILHLSGAEVGNINNSKNFVRKFRPELAAAVRQMKIKFLTSPTKATAFLPGFNFTGDGATTGKRSRQFMGINICVPDSLDLIQSIFLGADLLTEGKTGVLLTQSILKM